MFRKFWLFHVHVLIYDIRHFEIRKSYHFQKATPYVIIFDIFDSKNVMCENIEFEKTYVEIQTCPCSYFRFLTLLLFCLIENVAYEMVKHPSCVSIDSYSPAVFLSKFREQISVKFTGRPMKNNTERV